MALAVKKPEYEIARQDVRLVILHAQGPLITGNEHVGRVTRTRIP